MRFEIASMLLFLEKKKIRFPISCLNKMSFSLNSDMTKRSVDTSVMCDNKPITHDEISGKL